MYSQWYEKNLMKIADFDILIAYSEVLYIIRVKVGYWVFSLIYISGSGSGSGSGRRKSEDTNEDGDAK